MPSPAEAYSIPTEKYFQEDAEGNINFLDPITGDTLKPDKIPESLLQDDELRSGFDFILKNSHRINFTLMLSSHLGPNNLAEAGIDLRGVAERLRTSNGVLFLEHSDKRARKPEKDVLGAKQFNSELGSQLSNTQIRVAFPDFSRHSDRPSDQALTAWWQAIEDTASTEELTQHGFENALLRQVAMYAGFQSYRDWYLVGKIGAKLSEFDSQDALNENIEAAMLVGSHHPGIGDLLKSAGAKVELQGIHDERLNWYDNEIVHVISTSKISTDDRKWLTRALVKTTSELNSQINQ